MNKLAIIYECISPQFKHRRT